MGDRLGRALVRGEDLPGFASADQTQASEEAKRELWCWHGGTAGEQPRVRAGRATREASGCLAPLRAGDKAVALVRLRGKKVVYSGGDNISSPRGSVGSQRSVLCLRFEDLQTDKLHNPAKVSLNIRQINSTFAVSTTPIYGAPFTLSFT